MSVAARPPSTSTRALHRPAWLLRRRRRHRRQCKARRRRRLQRPLVRRGLLRRRLARPPAPLARLSAAPFCARPTPAHASPIVPRGVLRRRLPRDDGTHLNLPSCRPAAASTSSSLRELVLGLVAVVRVVLSVARGPRGRVARLHPLTLSIQSEQRAGGGVRLAHRALSPESCANAARVTSSLNKSARI